jgi:hypothetical protein
MKLSGGVRSDLAAVADALVIDSAPAFTFGGRRFALSGERSPEETRTSLIAMLTDQLYENAFCRRFAEVSKSTPLAQPGGDLSHALAAANAGKPRWSDGWTIVAVEPAGRITAQLNATTRSFWPGEYVLSDFPANPPRAGAQARVHVGTASFVLQPGFFLVFGESLDDRRNGVEFVRFYWSIEAAAAPELVGMLSMRLNAFDVPFRLKCLTQSAAYARLDPAVLYVERRYFPIVAEIAAIAYARLGPERLRPVSPLFTKAVAPGLAIAEDPGTGDSFGMHRCGLVAEALWNAWESDVARDAWVTAIDEYFAKRGVSLERPYLNPGSVDDYDFSRTASA